MSIPRTTHQWLKPLYDCLEGKSGKYPVQLGSSTGYIGMFGASGVLQPSGVGATGGVTGTTFFDMRTNGGTGTNYYTFSDLILYLKARGDIAQ